MSNEIRPAADGVAVTKSDSTVYEGVRGVYIGGAGNLAIKFPGNDTAVTFTALAVGVVHPIQAEKVMSTNTTATDIVVVY